MRKLIIATAALAFIASPAFAQDKAGDKSAPSASSDTMSKDTMKKTTKKKSAKKTGDDAMTKQ